jgi:hypothetical protein
VKNESDHEQRWIDLFEKQQATLEEAAIMVLYRQEDPREILCAAINELKLRPFHEVFGPVSAIREIIKAAIARNDDFIEHEAELQQNVALPPWNSGPLPLEALPWAERAVYFMREVLHYARRDAALLLGICDGEVDQLTRSAKQRMGQPEDPPERSHHRRTQSLVSVRTQHSMAFAAFE